MKIGRVFEIAYSHRIFGHTGQCRNLHGHNGRVEVTVEGQIDPDTGMVMDFRDLKDAVVSSVLSKLDHSTILQSGDPLARADRLVEYGKHVLVARPPTAEVIAHYIVDELTRQLTTVSNIKVRFWESRDCYAEEEVYTAQGVKEVLARARALAEA